MDIEVNRIINDSNGALIKNGRVSISDETILAIGKRYFELASGKEQIKETMKPEVTAADALEAAYIIKEYCSKRMCPGCPFSYQTTSRDLLCKCCLLNDDEVSITPEKWKLPPREV